MCLKDRGYCDPCDLPLCSVIEFGCELLWALLGVLLRWLSPGCVLNPWTWLSVRHPQALLPPDSAASCRAMERRLDKQSVLRARGYSRVIDLSAAEKDGRHFEGTGALVLDRINGVAYVALSERADAALAEHWVDRLGYKVVSACTCPESCSCAPGQVCKWRVQFTCHPEFGWPILSRPVRHEQALASDVCDWKALCHSKDIQFVSLRVFCSVFTSPRIWVEAIWSTKVGAAVDMRSVAGPGDLPLKRLAGQARLPHQRAHGHRHRCGCRVPGVGDR